ncbi:SH3 domain-containing protein [Pseudoruegeria sp. SHC-113]|uniref:SH3 domain-containing protein n=1 Tax=Pseudoruegeria sp. SHC-113 TaxID=2855439 RepID=UPI0021BB5258|nr:SH3 domain-containing protein [Pseudoruegeria sp. SHC-113]MCT8159295.1 SH3 domain-containing protein [Pseudoruegeria sp. SHC-113]
MVRLIVILSLCLFGAMYFIPAGDGASEAAEVAQAEGLPSEIKVASLDAEPPVFLAPAPEAEAPNVEAAAAKAFPPAKRVAKMTSAPIAPEMLAIGKSDAPAGYVSKTAAKKIAQVQASGDDVWYVTGSRVNMRSGPSTANGVLASLTRGSAAEMIALEANGWARIRDLTTGQTGYMSAKFLSRSAP